jgi:hypothetical protein
MRQKDQQHPEMEEALYVWFAQSQARDLAINEDTLKEKAREFGKQTGVAEDLGFSPGWLDNFKKHYGIVLCAARRSWRCNSRRQPGSSSQFASAS